MELFKSKNQPTRRSRARDSQYITRYINRSKPKSNVAQQPVQLKSSGRRVRRLSLGQIRRYIFYLAMLYLVIHSLIIQPDPQVTVSSTSFHSLATYEQALKHEYQNLLNRNKITMSKKSIESKMRKQFPEIVKITFDVSVLSQTPRVDITIGGPSLVLNSGLESYVINSGGVAVSKAASLPSASKLPVLVDQTKFEVSIGKQVLAAKEVDFIITILSQCARAQVPVASLTLPPLAQELDLRTSDRGYFVKYYLGGDPVIQTGQFLAARHDFDAKNQQPSTYLDVRVTGKVYYK